MCAIDLFLKYARVVPLKDKGETNIVNAFQKLISKGRKPNKIWVDQGGEFYNKHFKRLFKKDIIEIYSPYNQRKSVVAKRPITTLETKIFKHMAAISKSAYFDVLDDIVNKYNNTNHRTTKRRPIDVTSILMLNTVKILIKKIPNLKLVIVSEYQNTKTFLLKDIPKIVLQKFLSLAKLKM